MLFAYACDRKVVFTHDWVKIVAVGSANCGAFLAHVNNCKLFFPYVCDCKLLYVHGCLQINVHTCVDEKMVVASLCGCMVLVAHVCDLNLLSTPGELHLLCTNVLIKNCCLHMCVVAK